MRPPAEDVERRRAEREAAARAKPVAPRVTQVFMAMLLPFLILIGAVRAVASPVFLWAEYFRPGFPGDGYGFSSEDRLTYGSYAVDYLANFASPRYLGDLVLASGEKLFSEREVAHMADVKLVVLSAYGAGAALLVFFVVVYLAIRRTRGAFARGLFAGSLVTVFLVVALAVLGLLGWQQFFTEFHRIFFADGTWTFSLEDTLIRLFPGQFWIDAALAIAVLTFVTAVLIAVFTWPRRVREDDGGTALEESGSDEAGPAA
ncbi:TIGR01906 family membrane protein [Sinomonas halotolerans]|uniref:TIGR01906 family membrane protein n=1 Tax=Sinomonas halotolerans TaxID=1644133 RepID=UPI0031F5989F